MLHIRSALRTDLRKKESLPSRGPFSRHRSGLLFAPKESGDLGSASLRPSVPPTLSRPLRAEREVEENFPSAVREEYSKGRRPSSQKGKSESFSACEDVYILAMLVYIHISCLFNIILFVLRNRSIFIRRKRSIQPGIWTNQRCLLADQRSCLHRLPPSSGIRRSADLTRAFLVDCMSVAMHRQLWPGV